MVSINGEVIPGLGAARETLKRQMPYFVNLLPELAVCHLASINLRLQSALRIENPDYTTARIPWAGSPGEVFSFLRISLEFPVGGKVQPGWIYIPHDSPHFHKCFQIEVLSSYVGGILSGSICRIHIPREYRESTLIVI
jgi:hypothetical protein